MHHRLLTLIIVITSLSLLTGCGGGKSKKGKAPAPAPAVVDPVPSGGGGGGGGGGAVEDETTPDGGTPIVPEGTDTGDPGTGDPGTGDPGTGDPGTGDPGTGDPGTGDPGTGGTGDPFELPSGEINPTDPIFPGDTGPTTNEEGMNPGGSEIAMPEPATLLSTILGAALLSIRRTRRQTHE